MTAVLSSGAAAGRRAASRLWWYVTELTGENAYDRYVEHLRRHHPEAQVPSRRAFEKERMDARDADPREGNCIC